MIFKIWKFGGKQFPDQHSEGGVSQAPAELIQKSSVELTTFEYSGYTQDILQPLIHKSDRHTLHSTVIYEYIYIDIYTHKFDENFEIT